MDFMNLNNKKYDAIIFSSILHEISSYSEDLSKRFSEIPIKEALEKTNDLLEDNAILISFKYNGKIKSHIFQMLNENIFNYNYVIEEKKKNMYNYFVIFLTKILHYLPEIEKTKDNFYPEFDYKSIFENIKKMNLYLSKNI